MTPAEQLALALDLDAPADPELRGRLEEIAEQFEALVPTGVPPPLAAEMEFAMALGCWGGGEHDLALEYWSHGLRHWREQLEADR